ncbi:hypothetical protein EUGRSUZ_L00830 [Eucalyptus grandis]|uniref:Uncharacterized protein n=2 Tax=Eucalyptus grandis TaxID=71139 RepID=A0ACC3LA27_EUCGR|nr:hypothetical protein EUGRSUZ_L00830 [Eucalyptus grandis]
MIMPIQIMNFGRNMFRSLTGAMLWLIASRVLAAESPCNVLDRQALLLSRPLQSIVAIITAVVNLPCHNGYPSDLHLQQHCHQKIQPYVTDMD